MTREQAIELARKHAYAKPTSYVVGHKREQWMPHEWVIDALREAYDLGESDEFNRADGPPPGLVHKPKG